MSATCPWCNAPRVAGPTCPHCGADYAKAEAIKTFGHASVNVTPQSPATATQDGLVSPGPAEDAIDATAGGVEDPALELKLCMGAIPAMLGVALLFHAFHNGLFLQTTFLAMPVHELGHAVTAWLCGYSAVPTLWKTLVPETRGFIAPALLAGAAGTVVYRAWQARRRSLLVLGGALLLLQIAGTFFISEDRANMFIVYGGNGIGMVIATLLMASFFFGKTTQLYTSRLRWGLLAIGAAAFVNIFGIWWAAHQDYGKIPFGSQEGVGLSDASKLVNWYGWSGDQLVHRYLMTGIWCLSVLAAVYLWGVLQAWREVKALDGRR